VSSEPPVTLPPAPPGPPVLDPERERQLDARDKGKSCLKVLFITVLVILALVAIAVGGCFLLIFSNLR
jgi:hypothetical protein